jgi:hypothetical protein
MLGKLSIFGAVAGIIMIPTALSAQMGGAVNLCVPKIRFGIDGGERRDKLAT